MYDKHTHTHTHSLPGSVDVGLTFSYSRIRNRTRDPHLVPGDLGLHPGLYVIIYPWAGDLLVLAELRLLGEPHQGVVAEVGVVLRHRQRHGHLHAVRGVPEEGRRRKNDGWLAT